MQVTAEINKIRKSDLTVIFIEPSETINSFLKVRLVLQIKNVPNVIKTRFYLKRGCIKIREHAETFHANKDYKLTIVLSVPISLF